MDKNVIKKSDLLYCTSEELKSLFDEVIDILKMCESGEVFIDKVKTDFIDKYKDTNLCMASSYVFGELNGKIEIGVSISELIDNIKNILKEDVTTVDDLLKKYKPRTIN